MHDFEKEFQEVVEDLSSWKREKIINLTRDTKEERELLISNLENSKPEERDYHLKCLQLHNMKGALHLAVITYVFHNTVHRESQGIIENAANEVRKAKNLVERIKIIFCLGVSFLILAVCLYFLLT